MNVNEAAAEVIARGLSGRQTNVLIRRYYEAMSKNDKLSTSLERYTDMVLSQAKEATR